MTPGAASEEDIMKDACRAVLLTLLLLPVHAAAQQGAPSTAADLRDAAHAMDCAALAAMPGAPMTREACEAHKASGLRLGQSMDQAGGERPGDDAMTCDQVAAELHTLQVAGVSADHAAESQAAGEQLRQSQQQAQAEAAAMAARQTVETAAAGAAPNAVAGAVVARQAAEQQALARRAGEQTKAAHSRTTLAVAAANQDLAASMQANPRWGHLVNVAATRCSSHPAFTGEQTP